MTIAAPVVTLLLAITAMAGTFFWWRARGATEVEQLAFDCSDFLGEVIALGGLSRESYLTQQRLDVEAALDQLARRLRDRKLRKLVRVALGEYRKAFGYSVPMRTPRVINLASPGPSMRKDEIDLHAAQHDAACKALDAFDAVLTRVHELNRWTLSPTDSK